MNLLHPEVIFRNIGLVISLYAGTSIIISTYSFFIRNQVTKGEISNILIDDFFHRKIMIEFKLGNGLSAGNWTSIQSPSQIDRHFLCSSTSETSREKTLRSKTLVNKAVLSFANLLLIFWLQRSCNQNISSLMIQPNGSSIEDVGCWLWKSFVCVMSFAHKQHEQSSQQHEQSSPTLNLSIACSKESLQHLRLSNLFKRHDKKRFLETVDLSSMKNSSNQINKIPIISEHVPIHQKPLSNMDFAYYLAGLIDGDGSFMPKQLIIAFSGKDASLAYYIKSRLGYGTVSAIKGKRALKLVISNPRGLFAVLNLINGKIRHLKRFEQIKTNILPYMKEPWVNTFLLDQSTNLNLDNYWLAGFAEAESSFQVKLLAREKRTEVRLNFQLDQKTEDLLKLIQQKCGGYVGYCQKIDCYYYESTNFKNAGKFISYFDRFHLSGSKYLDYMKWRKIYLYILQKRHLTTEGIAHIRQIKKTMNPKSNEIFDKN